MVSLGFEMESPGPRVMAARRSPEMESQDRVLTMWLNDHHLSERCFKLCLRLLEDGVGNKHIATLIHFNVRNPFPNPKDWFTQAHLDLLVDYHFRICEGSDYDRDAVKNTFTILTWLRGSPTSQDRKCCYIDTMIRFMGQKETRDSALLAACSVPTVLASVDGDNGIGESAPR